MGGLPRYLATAQIDDPERIAWLADDLLGGDSQGPVVLLQCGRPSTMAVEIGRQLGKVGRRSLPLVIRDRATAQADSTVSRMAGASAVWVFADDMLEAFMILYATHLSFSLRAKARAGLPVLGLGGGAVSLGGLLLATRVCGSANYDLVAGLGFAARTFIDSHVVGFSPDETITRAAVQSLPGLLNVQLGVAGAVRAEGGRIESIGSEPIEILGTNEDGTLLRLQLDPGQRTTIAPPPFAPFERGLLPPDTLRALGGQLGAKPNSAHTPVLGRARTPALPSLSLRQAPPPPDVVSEPVVKTDTHARPGGGRYCPMCKKVHGGDPKVELAA
jgi:hypothetical protein